MTTKDKETTKKTQKQKAFDPYAPHKIKWWGWPLLLLLIVGTVYIIKTRDGGKTTTNSQGEPWKVEETQRSEGSVFGTFYHLTYQADKSLQAGVDATLQQVDMSLSPFNKESVISAINNNTNMETDAMFTEVFTLAQEVSAATDGAFDITVAPLVNLWGFGFKNMDNVSQEKVDSLLPYVGYTKVKLVEGKIVKQCPETMLDCSAIAKGYGVDAVGKYLESQGVKNYMVEIGGEVRVRGSNPKGALWHVGINKPDDDPTNLNNEIEEVLQITQRSMATSGNYRNFYEKDGKKYAHTIDPRTGYPVQHSILSSTVLAEDCATADAYATSFMVLGLDKAKAVLAKHPELMAFFIYSDEKGEMQEWYTESLNGLIIGKEVITP
ncbi:MAG: FAD:protein FMN transferase [Bacteroidaceae bacterium]|nr:FAD:protein FMN transferase [Bacteroidaceae bacterium]